MRGMGALRVGRTCLWGPIRGGPDAAQAAAAAAGASSRCAVRYSVLGSCAGDYRAGEWGVISDSGEPRAGGKAYQPRHGGPPGCVVGWAIEFVTDARARGLRAYLRKAEEGRGGGSRVRGARQLPTAGATGM
jgi:hypothetical protein